MDAKDTLIAARKIIEHPQNWTQGAWGRDEEGNLVSYISDRAVCWCSEGAIKLASGGKWELYRAASRVLEQVIPLDGEPKNITGFNDTHTHVEVLALLDKAIAAA